MRRVCLAVAVMLAALATAQPALGSEALAGRVFRVSNAAHAHIAALADGGVLVTTDDYRVWLVSPYGRPRPVAGNGKDGFAGDGGPATAAKLDVPRAVAAMPDGGFVVEDVLNKRVRRVWPDGHISTVAGNGKSEFAGDGGPATSAALSAALGLAALPDGGFLFADRDNHRVRRVWPDGIITTVAGDGSSEVTGDGGPATAAGVGDPEEIAVLPDGGFLIGGDGIRRVAPDGTIMTIANVEADGGLALAGDGAILAGSVDDAVVRRITMDGHVSVVAGAGKVADYLSWGSFGDGGLAMKAQFFDGIWDVAATPDGGFLLAAGDGIRWVIGPGTSPLIGAAIDVRRSVASGRRYSLRYAVTEPADLTVTLDPVRLKMRPVTATGSAPGGDATFQMDASRVAPDLYQVILGAVSGGRSFETGELAWLGGRLTCPGIWRLIAGTRKRVRCGATPAARAADEGTWSDQGVNRCRAMTRTRVDCEWYYADVDIPWGCGWIAGYFLTRSGEIYRRLYDCPTKRRPGTFKAHPRWEKHSTWIDLGWGSPSLERS